MNYPPRNPILPLCLLFFQHTVLAQDKLPIKFGKLDIGDLHVKSSLTDSDTTAVLVPDVGSLAFIANTREVGFSLIIKEETLIKNERLNDIDIIRIW